MMSFFKNLLNKSKSNEEKRMNYLQEKYSEDIENYRIIKAKKEEWIKPIFNHLKYIENIEKITNNLHQAKKYDEELETLKKCAKYCFDNELISEKIYETKEYYNMIYHAKLYCNRKINMIKKEQDTLNFKPYFSEENKSKKIPFNNNSKKSDRKPIPNRIRHQVFQRDNYRCCECGARLEDGATLEIDHIVPVSRGGTNDISNLQTLCKACNRGKYTDTWVGGRR